MIEKFRIFCAIIFVVGCFVAIAYAVTIVKVGQTDLSIIGVVGPSFTVPGEHVNLTATVKNAGSGYCSDSYTSFYLSNDTSFDPSDSYLGSEFTPSLSSGSSLMVSYSASIPSSLSGAYYFLAIADGSNTISENDERNNVGISSQMTIDSPISTNLPISIPTSDPFLGKIQSTKPDLVITEVTVPSYAVSGGHVTLSATVKNAGSGYSSDFFYISYYLSKNRIVDPSDSYLGREYISSLSPGSSQTVSPSVPIPSGSSGVYYILLKADSSNSISEENERNNVRYSTPLEAFVITPNDTLHAGVALTFDDGKYIDDWYAIRPILKKYNAHATFFVSNLDSINQSQIEKLRILQADGNEIAFHGYSHLEVVEYLKTHSIGQYLEYEIIPGIDLMRSWGLNPVDFAYPYGSADPAANQVLFGYFGHVRGIHNNNWNDDIYYTYGSNTPFIVSMGIDNHYGNSDETIYAGILKAKMTNKIVILYGHKPVASTPGQYETSYDRLEKIFQYVSDNNMKTYTIAEMN